MQQVHVTLLLLVALLTGGCALSSGGGDDRQIPNDYLWNATVDTVDFLPVARTDRAAGLVETGWGSAEGAGQQYRVTALIAGPELEARNLKLAVFRRSGRGEVPAAAETVRALENAILLRARQLRIADRDG